MVSSFRAKSVSNALVLASSPCHAQFSMLHAKMHYRAVSEGKNTSLLDFRGDSVEGKNCRHIPTLNSFIQVSQSSRQTRGHHRCILLSCDYYVMFVPPLLQACQIRHDYYYSNYMDINIILCISRSHIIIHCT